MGPTTGAEALLQIDGLACSYGGIDVLHGVDMQVGAGEAVCLVGPNGAGKTTLAKAVTGLVRPTAGDVRFDGVTLNRLARQRRDGALGVAIVLEGRHVFVEQSVRANLQLGAYRRRLRRPEPEEELDKVYGLFGDLRRFETKLAGSLSGGQQQMLCVGRALMSAPRLLILDEPSMGLSPKLASELYATMTQLRGGGADHPPHRAERRARLPLLQPGLRPAAGKHRRGGDRRRASLHRPRPQDLHG